MIRELEAHGFANLRLWSRGVDADFFQPGPKDAFPDLKRPVFLSVGRVAVEKNIEAFLALDLPGSKVVVGEGPSRAELMARYPGVHFTGPISGFDLVRAYRSADVFVFPSRTDTFGLVLLEALASGVPVAAYPVTRAAGCDRRGAGAARCITICRLRVSPPCDIPADACRAFALDPHLARGDGTVLRKPRAHRVRAAHGLAAHHQGFTLRTGGWNSVGCALRVLSSKP